MSFPLQPPGPPRALLHDPVMFTLGVIAGLLFVLGVTVVVDKLGTAMYHRGFAKPFYIRGRRIHHSCIYAIAPISYGILSTLFFFGYIGFTDIWLRVAYTGVVCAACVAVDFLGDKFWPEIRKNVIIHHEWVYAIIPAYIFTFVIVVTL